MGGVAAAGVFVVGFDAMASSINGESAGDIAVETAKGTATGLVIAGGVGLMTGAVGGFVLGGGPPGAVAGFIGGFNAGFGATAVVGTAVGTVKTGKKLGEIAGQLGEGAADGPTAELGERAKLGEWPEGIIKIPKAPPIDDWDRTLGPLFTPAEIEEILGEIKSIKSKGELTDADRDRAKKGLADSSTTSRARDADGKLTAREREAAQQAAAQQAAAQQAAGSGQGLPGGGGYSGPSDAEIGAALAEDLIKIFGGGGGGQMGGKHPPKKR